MNLVHKLGQVYVHTKESPSFYYRHIPPANLLFQPWGVKLIAKLMDGSLRDIHDRDVQSSQLFSQGLDMSVLG